LRDGRQRANLAVHRVVGSQSGHGPAPETAAEEELMRSSIAARSRHRLAAPARALLAATLLVAPTLAMAGGARAADDLILKVGTDQKLETLNPWLSVTVADYEIFQVQYELLVGFDNALNPTPAFADSWEESADKLTHTFHIREGMKWSDGEPATCEDARYTYQLVLDAAASETGYLGSGYLDPYLTNAGLKSVACEAGSLVATTEFPTTLLLQAYVPILPKHIWSKYSLDQIGNDTADGFFQNAPGATGDVGSGPYVVVEWRPGEFIRMARNPNYWGTPGVPKEIIFQQFSGSDTLVSALKAGDIDYVRGTGADQFDALKTDPNIGLSEGFANGYTYLSMNTRGNTGGYNASTSALADQKFRDAIGYAIDRQALVDKVLNGHGVPGTTHVPPYHVKWHVEPANPRTFNIAEANTRLDAAGYPRNADNKRVDKDGKVINLRLTWPDSEDHSADAQFIAGWFEQIGIGVEAFVTEENTLYEDLAGPESGGEADWDFYMWGWTGDPDPMSLLSFFTTDQIEPAINDPFYSSARYDELFGLQQRAIDEATRKTYIAEMQQLFYDAAAYHILYNDSELHAYRTDKFKGWTNQPPETGTPLFGYGYSGYMALTDASAVPTPGPTVVATAGPSGAAVTPAPTQAPGGTDAGSNSTPILIGGVVVIVVLVAGFILLRRRGSAQEDE
jgi:peptide/nickel transport system substrate-binding protein